MAVEDDWISRMKGYKSKARWGGFAYNVKTGREDKKARRLPYLKTKQNKKTTYFTQWVPGQPRLQSETQSQKTQQV